MKKKYTSSELGKALGALRPIQTHSCIRCGKVFTAIDIKAKYCGVSCRSSAFRERRKTEVAAMGMASAKSGCCSRHEGVCGCDADTGYIQCCDKSDSKSCRCDDYLKSCKEQPQVASNPALNSGTLNGTVPALMPVLDNHKRR